MLKFRAVTEYQWQSGWYWINEQCKNFKKHKSIQNKIDNNTAHSASHTPHSLQHAHIISAFSQFQMHQWGSCWGKGARILFICVMGNQTKCFYQVEMNEESSFYASAGLFPLLVLPIGFWGLHCWKFAKSVCRYRHFRKIV